MTLSNMSFKCKILLSNYRDRLKITDFITDLNEISYIKNNITLNNYRVHYFIITNNLIRNSLVDLIRIMLSKRNMLTLVNLIILNL